MHGRPRPKKGAAEDPEKLRKQKQRAALYGQLAAEVLGRRAAGRSDPESLTLAAKLLELNPEVYTVWNYRREVLLPVLEDPGSDAACAAVAAELALTLKALHVNPKSYAAWHHRRWTVERGAADLQRELALVQKLLSLDDRNFVGWAYWRWVVNKARIPAEECLAFTNAKLQENFSNYSAWHARSALLAAAAAPATVPTLAELMAEERAGGAAPSAQPDAAMPPPVLVPQGALDREFDLVHRAFWTEPRDQSAWLYHRWLLGSCLASAGVTIDGSGGGNGGGRAVSDEPSAGSGDPVALQALQGRLGAEAAMCQELLEEEPEAKWPLLTLARVREAQAALQQQQQQANSSLADAAQQAGGRTAVAAATAAAAGGSGSAAGAVDVPDTKESQSASAAAGMLYERLAALDPKRAGYYRDAAEGRARVVLRAAGA